MRRIFKYAGFVFLLVLVSTANLSAAQDKAQITIVGSRIGNALIDSVSQVSASDIIEMKTTGTAAGIAQFCSDGVDVVSALRPISAAEVAECISNEVNNSEFLIAHKIVAFAANKSVPANCISRSQLEAFVKPSVSNQKLDWSYFTEDGDGPDFDLLLPDDNSLEFNIVDDLVVGDRLRHDAHTYGDPAQAIARLVETEGALAVLTYTADLASNEELKLLDFQDDDAANCTEPSAENVESRLYTAAQSIYVYVNRERLDTNDPLLGLVEELIDDSNIDAIVAAGYSAPSSERIELNATVLTDPSANMAMGDGETDFEMPTNLAGEINISGAANAYQLLKRVSDSLARDNVQLAVNIEAGSSDAAISDLCSGDINIAMLDLQIKDVPLFPCEDRELVTVSLPIGAQAPVLVGNSADEYAQCLTLDQITAIWQASASDSVTSWHDIDESFPSQDLVLFGLLTVDRNADMLLARAGQATPPIRRDTERDFDPLYRAAAVGNVPGSLTYMSWHEYENVLEAQQQNVRLVSVDAGSGCVSPSDDSIVDGSYPISRSASLLLVQASLADVNVQALLWNLYTDENWNNFEREGFVGIELADLSSHRRQLETQFRLAEAAVIDAESAEDSESTDDADADESG